MMGTALVNDVKLSTDVINDAGLNWEVEKKPLRYEHNGEVLTVPDKVGIVRSDNGVTLSVMGDNYGIIQNKDCFSFFDEVVALQEAEFIRAGESQGGRKIFIEARIPGVLTIGTNDKLEQRVYLWNSHDGNAFKVFYSPLRLFCKNQLTGSFSGNVYKQYAGDTAKEITGIRIRHKGNIAAKLNEAQGIIKKAIIHFETFQIVANKMYEKEINKTEASDYFRRLTLTDPERKGEKPSTRVKNIRENLSTLFVRGKGNQGRSVWDAYNAVTEYADWHKTERKGTDKMADLFYGTAGRLKQGALNAAAILVN